MAIWQYSFLVLPNESLNSLGSDYVFNPSDGGFDDELFWNMRPLKNIFFNKVNFILEKTKSWSDEIDLYGNEESNLFEVISDNQCNVTSVSFRIDFRSNYELIIRGIIEICILGGLVILDEELHLVPLNYEQIRSIIELSPQVKKYHELITKDIS